MAKSKALDKRLQDIADQSRINADQKTEPIPKELKELPIGTPDFQKAYEEAKRSGRLKRKTYQIHSWGIDGDELIGKILDVRPFEGGKFEGTCNQYLIETSQGNRSFIMGSYTDSQLVDIELKGQLVRIQFLDKKKLDDGRSVNMFDVIIAGE